jgi:hypothetical protein
MDLPEYRRIDVPAHRVIESKAPSAIASTLKYLQSHGPAIGALIGSMICVFIIIKAFGA